MDYALLRSWLGLPIGPWPPDHYTLLGFAVGRLDPAVVEARVMARMDTLRHYQLLHPDLVTEGMNRLAQALITLTDPAGKTAYDAELNVAAPSPLMVSAPPVSLSPELDGDAPFVIAEPVFDDDVFADDEPLGERPDSAEMTQIIDVAGTGGGVAPYEVVSDSEVRPPVPLVFDYAERPSPPVPAAGVVEAKVLDAASPELIQSSPVGRRWIYSRLALVRRALRAWDRLRPVLADPHDPFDRVGRILILLEAVQAVRPVLPALRGVVGSGAEPGAVVATLCNHAFMLDTLRRLLPEQRRTLAIDWRRAQDELQREYARLRGLARERGGRTGAYGNVPALVRWLKHTPELVLAGLVLLALFIAVVQTVRRH